MNTTNIPEITTSSVANITNITTVQSLVAEANRRGFKLTGGFHPPHIIPMVQAAIQQHNTRERGYSETSGDYIEWKQTMDNLQEFLALLKTLPERLPYGTGGTAKLPLGETEQQHNDNKEQGTEKDDEEERLHEHNNDSDTDSLIEKVEKYLAENGKNAGALPPQRDPTAVEPPDTRRSAAGHPSNRAPDPATAASSDATTSTQSTQSTLAGERAEYYAQLLRESAAAKSPIDDLPPERQRALYQLMKDGTPRTVIVKMIGAPEPLGWGFKTSDRSLARFRERYRKKAEAAERAQTFAEANAAVEQTGANEQTYMDATRRLLKIRLFKNAADPKGSDEKLELLMRLLDRHRRTDLAERRVKTLENRTKESK